MGGCQHRGAWWRGNRHDVADGADVAAVDGLVGPGPHEHRDLGAVVRRGADEVHRRADLGEFFELLQGHGGARPRAKGLRAFVDVLWTGGKLKPGDNGSSPYRQNGYPVSLWPTALWLPPRKTWGMNLAGVRFSEGLTQSSDGTVQLQSTSSNVQARLPGSSWGIWRHRRRWTASRSSYTAARRSPRQRPAPSAKSCWKRAPQPGRRSPSF